jgi:hypothetical protein
MKKLTFKLSIVFATGFIFAGFFAANLANAADEAPKYTDNPIVEVSSKNQSQAPKKLFELPNEVAGEGKLKTKIEPEGYGLSDSNKELLYNTISDYEIAILSQRNSLVYTTKNKEFKDEKVFFKVLTIFSKLDSTEITDGIPADVLNEPVPVYTILNFIADCGTRSLSILASDYFDKDNKRISGLSTQIPQEGIKPEPKNLDGQILALACEQLEAHKKANPEPKTTKEQ